MCQSGHDTSTTAVPTIPIGDDLVVIIGRASDSQFAYYIEINRPVSRHRAAWLPRYGYTEDPVFEMCFQPARNVIQDVFLEELTVGIHKIRVSFNTFVLGVELNSRHLLDYYLRFFLAQLERAYGLPLDVYVSNTLDPVDLDAAQRAFPDAKLVSSTEDLSALLYAKTHGWQQQIRE